MKIDPFRNEGRVRFVLKESLLLLAVPDFNFDVSGLFEHKCIILGIACIIQKLAESHRWTIQGGASNHVGCQ